MHRIQLDLEIRFPNRWHTGSGESRLMIDRPIRRDSRNRPFIPASTLKGIIRQSCEKLSRTLGYPEPSDPHQPEWMHSPVDQLFGTKFEPGSLFFRDAKLDDDETIQTFTQNRIARYRMMNTDRNQHLFSTEYAAPATLKTRIDGRHANLVNVTDDYPPIAYCLLIAAIYAVERIGGDKSGGTGWLKDPITITKIDYNGFDVDTSLLFALLDPAYYIHIRGAS